MRRILVIAFVLLLAGCAAAPNPWVENAEQQLSEGDLDGAIALYELALEEDAKRDEHDPVIPVRLAALLERSGHERLDTGDTRVALERFQQALALYEEGQEPVTVRRGVVDAERALELSPEERRPALVAVLAMEDDAELLLELAIMNEILRDDAGALDALMRLDAMGAAEPPQLMQLARLHEATDQLAEAIAAYRRYLELEPESALGRASLARVLEAKGASAEAGALLEQNAAASPESMRAWRALYAFYQRQGDTAGQARVKARIDALGGSR